MATPGDIYLGLTSGTPILLTPYGREFTEADIELSRQERTADGTLVKEIISVKKRFTLSYSMIDFDYLKPIIDLYYTQIAGLTLDIYYEDSTTTTGEYTGWDSVGHYNVLMDPIEKTRLLTTNGGIWSNVSIVLHEV